MSCEMGLECVHTADAVCAGVLRGGRVVALACVGLVGWRIIVPAWWASVLHRHEVAVQATVQARSQRMRVGGLSQIQCNGSG